MKSLIAAVLGLVWCGASTAGAAALELPAIFSDGMVLQRDMPVPVWGKAEPGQRVQVALSVPPGGVFNTAADQNGDWRVELPAMSASAEPITMRVVVDREIALDEIEAHAVEQVWIKDILVGDVWHCSGQSNMQWTVAASDHADREIRAADFANLRMFRVPRTAAPTPQFSSGGAWRPATREHVAQFSAVGYFFGRTIHASQGVPIGLIDTSWGAAHAEAFTSIPSMERHPVIDDQLLTHRAETEYRQKLEQRGEDVSELPRRHPQHTPAALWHGMIHTVAPFAHRGVLWYQGEGNAPRAAAYRTLLPTMIEDWRTLWDQPAEHRDTPFLIVQLAHFKQPSSAPPASDAWAELRDSQAAAAAAVPNAWVTTAVDVGDADDIHPRNKQEVGRRLAQLAEHHVYGDASVVPVGPTLRDLGDGGKQGVVRVHFDHAEGLTTTDGQPPRGFAIRPLAGDRTWVWADADLDGTSVKLRHPDAAPGPFEVRYAYGINPTDGPRGINLVNGAGLPAMPFRTDPAPVAE